MRETRTSGSEGGGSQLNCFSLPLSSSASVSQCLRGLSKSIRRRNDEILYSGAIAARERAGRALSLFRVFRVFRVFRGCLVSVTYQSVDTPRRGASILAAGD